MSRAVLPPATISSLDLPASCWELRLGSGPVLTSYTVQVGGRLGNNNQHGITERMGENISQAEFLLLSHLWHQCWEDMNKDIIIMLDHDGEYWIEPPENR